MWYAAAMSRHVMLTRSSVQPLPLVRTGTESSCVVGNIPLPGESDFYRGPNAVDQKDMAVNGGLPGEQPPEDGKEYYYCRNCGDGPFGKWQGACPECGCTIATRRS